MTARPRGRARTGLAVLAAALVLVPAPALVFGGAPASAAGSAKVDRTVGDSRIEESSGLAASLLRPGVLWTHNDSGNPARLYALGPDGATVDTVKVSGTLDRDWEAITAFRGRSGRPMLAVGDIGDNNEHDDTVQVVVLDEPRAGDTRARPVALLSLRYPTGPVNAESLMVDPTSGRMYLATKELFRSRLFEVPAAAWPGGSGSTATLTEVGSVAIGLATDGAFLPDGRLLLRNYSSVLVLQRPAGLSGGRLEVLASVDTPVQDQGESVAVVDGGTGLLVGSEGKDEPIYRMPVPVAVDPSLLGSAGTPTTGAGSGSAAPPTVVPTVVQTPPAGATQQRSVGVDAGGSGGLGARILLGLLALAAVAGLIGATRYVRTRPGGHAGARRAGPR